MVNSYFDGGYENNSLNHFNENFWECLGMQAPDISVCIMLIVIKVHIPCLGLELDRDLLSVQLHAQLISCGNLLWGGM